MHNSTIRKISSDTASPPLRVQTPEPTTSTVEERTNEISANTPLNLHGFSASPTNSASTSLSAPQNPDTQLLYQLPLELIINVLSSLDRSTLTETVPFVTKSTRQIFAQPNGIISTAFKEQLESNNSRENPLTYEQYQTCLNSGSPPFPEHIRHLDLRTSNVNDVVNDAKLQAFVRQFPNLETLILTGCGQLTDAGLNHLAGLAFLQHLDLSYCALISDAGLTNFAATRRPKLRYLSLGHCIKISHVGLTNLVAGAPNLETFILKGCGQFTDAPLTPLAGLNSLRHLDLSFCWRITDAGLINFVANRCPHLEYLSLNTCPRISNLGLANLVAGAPNLLRLDLSGCYRLSGADLALLAGLALLHTLTIRHCRLQDEDLAHFIMLRLKRLDLQENSLITDVGLRHLASLPLEDLNLSNIDSITGVGLEYLHRLPLRKLVISLCAGITMPHLNLLMFANPVVKHLDISSCRQFPEALLEKFRKCHRLRRVKYGVFERD